MYLKFPMKTLRITQGVNGTYSHQGVNALDLAGKDAGIDETLAPCRMQLVSYDINPGSGNAVFFQSTEPVLFADGTKDYATFMFLHDNDISDIIRAASVGKTWEQWEPFGDEGTAGMAIGNHCHMEVAKGKYSHMYDKNSQGVWHLPGSVRPDRAFFVDGCTLMNGGQPEASGEKMKWKMHTAKSVPVISIIAPKEGYDRVYRVYNPNSGEHFYTINDDERENLINKGWTDEGLAFYTPAKSGTPVYRLRANFHVFTPNPDEIEHLTKMGWKNEGVAWYAGEGAEVYTLYNNNNGDHLLTTDKKEVERLEGIGLVNEGVRFKA